MDHWSWTISGVGAMGENNSTYLCRIPYKVASVRKETDNTLKHPTPVSEAPVVHMALGGFPEVLYPDTHTQLDSLASFPKLPY